MPCCHTAATPSSGSSTTKSARQPGAIRPRSVEPDRARRGVRGHPQHRLERQADQANRVAHRLRHGQVRAGQRAGVVHQPAVGEMDVFAVEDEAGDVRGGGRHRVRHQEQRVGTLGGEGDAHAASCDMVAVDDDAGKGIGAVQRRADQPGARGTKPDIAL